MMSDHICTCSTYTAGNKFVFFTEVNDGTKKWEYFCLWFKKYVYFCIIARVEDSICFLGGAVDGRYNHRANPFAFYWMVKVHTLAFFEGAQKKFSIA